MQRTSRHGAVFGILVVALWANASYLALGAKVTFWYSANIIAHVVLGGLAAAVSVRGLGQLVRDARTGDKSLARWSVGAMSATFATGGALAVLGNGSSSMSHGVWLAHTVVAVAASAGLVAVWKYPLTRFLLGAAIVIPVASHLITNAPRHDGVNAMLAPTSMNDEVMGGAQGPFFPSAAETADGKLIPSEFFKGSEQCGRCHTDIYDQWSSSAHHLASFNNQWYRKSIEYMQSVTGVSPSKWCAGCHDHALLFSGMMDSPVAEIVDTEEAHTGLACTSCHAISRVKNTSGNAGFVIEYPPLHDLATSDNPLIQAIHDFVLHLDPEPHRLAFLKPLHTGDSSAFCSACHKVHLDEPVNNYRWLRGFNSYDNWQASGVSGEGARSFYYPESASTCTDCHMPRIPGEDPASQNGLIQSHRFAAANTALPTAYGDAAQLAAVEDFLKAGQVSVDLFALVRSDTQDEGEIQLNDQARRLASTFAVGEESEMTLPGRRIPSAGEGESTVAPLDRKRPPLVRGESVRVDAVVRTRKVGHFFPGGTVDAFDCWLEVQGIDDQGRVFFWSGAAEPTGPVDDGAHFYRSFLLDARGNHIDKRNAWAARSTLYVQLIAPGAANTVRYRIRVPEDIGERVTLTVKLNYRKFSWWHTQWAYAGVRAPSQPEPTLDYDDAKWVMEGSLADVSGPMKAIPEVPIVTMAQTRIELDVVDRSDLPEDRDEDLAADRERWNDYGIGLFTQGDLRGAERAFRRVNSIDADYADGWVNLARVHVQEGDPSSAQAALEKALAIAPGLAKAHYFYGLTWKTLGDYGRALEHFTRAARAYPKDRVVRNQIGRIHFLNRDYRRAVESFQRTLRIDPEDLEAHYNLMLAYRGLGMGESSEAHRSRYLRFKADEGSQSITGDFRLANPKDNNERLPIHEHLTAPLR